MKLRNVFTLVCAVILKHCTCVCAHSLVVLESIYKMFSHLPNILSIGQ